MRRSTLRLPGLLMPGLLLLLLLLAWPLGRKNLVRLAEDQTLHRTQS